VASPPFSSVWSGSACSLPVFQGSPARRIPAQKPSPKRRENGGLVTCSCCDRVLQLVHKADGTHSVADTPFTGHPQLPAPPPLSAEGTLQSILKRTSGYTLDALPKGLNTVLTPQTAGFWARLEWTPANPDFAEPDVPERIFTLDPFLGCLFGTSCRFCYVPSLDTRQYPDGHQSYWYQQWGHWLLYKPDFPNRLRRQLLDEAGQTRPRYRGAAVYMSPKTDPLLPIKDALAITAHNLDVFLDAECFLMIQTRSKKVGVSFSISADLLDQQRRIEFGGLLPAERLAIMACLKDAGAFVSAAVAPLMPYSPDFARKLVDCCHHTSIQVLHLTGSGAATPNAVLDQTHSEIPHYRELDRTLAEAIDARGASESFPGELITKGLSARFSPPAGFTRRVNAGDRN
jgi:DNA repair photolyase